MIALLAAALFFVVAVLHTVGGASVDVVLTDLGLMGICLALVFPSVAPWRRA